jgi:hypothetical protein
MWAQLSQILMYGCEIWYDKIKVLRKSNLHRPEPLYRVRVEIFFMVRWGPMASCSFRFSMILWPELHFVKEKIMTREEEGTQRRMQESWSCTRACSPAAEARFSCLCHLGSSPSVHACHPRGVLSTCWACRVFSGSGD